MTQSQNFLSYFRSLLTPFFLAALPWAIGAQQTVCLTQPEPSSAGYNPSWNNMNEEGPFYIRIYIHVIRDGNGAGGQTPEQVAEALGYLDEAFNPHNIYFVQDCEIDYIDNSSYALQFGNPAVFSINNHTDGIDIYLFPDFPFPVNVGGGFANWQPNSTYGLELYVGGNVWFPPYPPIVRSHVLSHEMGHCLGLVHTFSSPGPGNNGQIVNDPNCQQGETFTPNGDHICDTPAGPNMDYNVNPNTCFWNSSGVDNNGDPYDPDEKNIMAYSHLDCEEYFSAGQGQLMRNTIATTPLLSDCLIPFSFTDHQITANTTWAASEYLISGTLSVEPGFALTISSNTKVRFAEGAKLVIKPNAVVYLDGKLTSFCDRTWKGVEVWGNSSASQFAQGGVLSQGKFVGRNGSVVENAETGVQLWGPDYDTGGGGQISCSGTSFFNNIVGVATAPYNNFWPFQFPSGWQNQPRNYVGYFTACNFETNNEYPHSSSFFAFANLVTVNGIRFSGCHFENKKEIEDCAQITDHGYGIFAQNAGFSVLGQCLDIYYPCGNYNRSSFKGLGYGIHTHTLLENRPYLVKQADFEDCFFGIYQNEVSAATVINNTFRLGNLPSISCTTDQFGAVIGNNTEGITFQENKFLKVSGNATKTVGTWCFRLSEFDNVIRKNKYEGITSGNIASGWNGTVNSIPAGLLYDCNENINIQEYDFQVQNVPGQGNGRIRNKQGLILASNEFGPAGNKFSYTGAPNDSDFRGHGAPNGIWNEYFYAPLLTNQEPLQIGGIIKVPSLNTNDCATIYCDPPCKEPHEVLNEKQRYYNNRNVYQTAFSAYLTAVGTGNTSLATTRANEAGYARQEMDGALHMVLLHTMLDTVGFNRDTLRAWLFNLNNFGGDIALSKDYIATGQYAMAQAVLNQIPGKYPVSSDDMSDLQALSSIYSIIAQQNLYAIDGGNLATIQNIAHGDMNYSTNLARGILELYNIEYFHPQLYQEGGKPSFERNEPAKTPLVEKKLNFSVFPNPTNSALFIATDADVFGDFQFRLSNISGKTVLVKNTATGTNRMVIEVEHLPEGLYFYEISSNNGQEKVQYGKVIIKK